MTARLLLFAVAFVVTAPIVSRAGDDCVREYLDFRRLIAKEQYDRAFERSVELLGYCADFPPLYEAIAEIGLYTRQWHRSEGVLAEQVRQGIEVQLALYGLAISMASRDDHGGAIRYCMEAIEGGLSYSGVFKELAYACEKTYGHDEAISILGRLSRRFPRKAGYHYAVALELWSKGDFRPVVSRLREAVVLDPGQACYGDALAVAELHLGYSRRKARYLEERRRSARSRGDIAGSQFLASSLLSDQIYAGDHCRRDTVLQESTVEASEFGFLRWLGWNLQRSADMEGLESRLSQALHHSMLARSLGLRAKDYGLVMVATQRISSAYLEAGILDSALQYARMRWSLTSRDKSASDYVSGLGKIALILYHMGHLQLANEYCVEALAEADSRSVDEVTLAEIETTCGMIQERLGNVNAAARHHMLARKVLLSVHPLPYCLAANSGNLGRTRMAEGLTKTALGLFEQELRIATAIEYPTEIANAQINIGDIAIRWRQFEKSSTCYIQALKIARRVGSCLLEFESLNRLAKLASARNQLDKALAYYLEVERVGIVSFLNGRTEFPEFVSALKEKAHLELSFGWWRAGLATLSAAKLVELHPFMGGAVFRSCRQNGGQRASAFRGVEARLASALEAVRRCIETRSASLSSRSAELQAMTEVVDAQLAVARIAREEARDSLPAWNTTAGDWCLDDLCALLNARSTCVIQYLVRDDETDVLCMNADTVTYKRLHISGDSLERQVHLMSAVMREGGLGVPLLHPSMAAFDYQVAHDLHQILIQPVRPFMKRVERLVIIPDAFLTFVPFDALVPTIEAAPAFLIEEFEVSYCWFLDQLRLKDPPNASGMSFLVIANPEIETGVPEQHGTESSPPVDLLRRARNRDLPDSQGEAAVIRQLFGGTVHLLVGKEASKDRVLRLLPHFSVIHVATHGVTNEREPDFMGLALGSSLADSTDGVLRLFELQGVGLVADLVVLNGCKTARGLDKSPGWSPAFAFTAAGACAAIGTLWDVHDGASSKLICDFYTGASEGLRASAALRKAKLGAIAGGKSHPVLWASHILIGYPDVHLGASPILGGLPFLQSALVNNGLCSCVCACCVVALIFLMAGLDRANKQRSQC